VQYGRSSLTFHTKILTPSLQSKGNPGKQPAINLPTVYLRGIHFHPEDGGSTLLPNFGERLSDYTASEIGNICCEKLKSNTELGFIYL
jgi:hypothetical protein